MIERKNLGGPRAVRVLARLTLVAAITSGCATATSPSGSSTGALAAAGTSSQVPAARSELLPLPRSVARRLPAGVFYLLAGPNPASYNLWEVSDTGAETQLTHNSRNFGISAFGASSAGIIMADSASGLDKLARLTPTGVRYLKDGTGSAPAINPTGAISYVVPPLDGKQDFTLQVRNSYSQPGHVVFRSPNAIGVGAFGPHDALAILVGSHYPGTSGPQPQMLILRSHGRPRPVTTGLGKQLGNIKWAPTAANIAAIGWNETASVIGPNGRITRLPRGWVPQAWSPAGTELLVWGPGTPGNLGLWSPKHPKVIVKIGEPSAKVQLGEFVWLSSKVKL